MKKVIIALSVLALSMTACQNSQNSRAAESADSCYVATEQTYERETSSPATVVEESVPDKPTAKDQTAEWQEYAYAKGEENGNFYYYCEDSYLEDNEKRLKDQFLQYCAPQIKDNHGNYAPESMKKTLYQEYRRGFLDGAKKHNSDRDAL